MTAKLCTALKAGNVRRAACRYAGISTDSFQRYFYADADFAAAVIRAEAEAEVAFIAVIQKAALKGDWKAAAWWATHHPNAKHDWRQLSEFDWDKAPTEVILALLGATESDPDAESAGDRLAAEAGSAADNE